MTEVVIRDDAPVSQPGPTCTRRGFLGALVAAPVALRLGRVAPPPSGLGGQIGAAVGAAVGLAIPNALTEAQDALERMVAALPRVTPCRDPDVLAAWAAVEAAEARARRERSW